MKHDIKSNYTVLTVEGQNSLAAAGTNASDSVDTSLSGSISFLIRASSVGTGGTLAVKLQYSSDNSSWSDEPDTAAGNDTSVTVSAAATDYRLFCPNPRARYIRAFATAATDTVQYFIAAVHGPKRYAAAAS